MKNKDEIEELFATSFEKFKEVPPLEMKELLDAKLFPNSTSKSNFFNWKWFFIILPFTTIVALSIYITSNNSTSNKTSRNDSQITKNQINNSNNNIYSSKKQKSTNSLSSTIRKNQQSNQSLSDQVKNVTESAQEIVESKTTFQKSKSQKSKNKYNQPKRNQTSIPSIETQVKNETHSLLLSNNIKQNKNKTNNNQERSQNSIITSIDSEKHFEIEQKNTIEEPKTIEDLKKSEVTLDVESSTEVVAENNSNPSTKSDSAQTKQETNSTKNNELKEPKNSDFEPNWNISFYGGIAGGINQIVPTSTLLKEKISSNFSLEVNYQFIPKFSLSSGFSLDKRTELWTKDFIKYDSTFTTNIQYIVDSNNVIIDSIVFTQIEVDTINFTGNQIISYSTFSIPLYFNYIIFEKNNWSGAVGAGVRLNYFNTIVNSSNAEFSNPILSKFGFQIQLRTQINYNWKKIGIGAYGSFGMDLKQATEWTEFTRKRYSIGTGLILIYRF